MLSRSCKMTRKAAGKSKRIKTGPGESFGGKEEQSGTENLGSPPYEQPTPEFEGPAKVIRIYK
mgnify:CR=1 FL=1